jgi:hypothetical protein
MIDANIPCLFSKLAIIVLKGHKGLYLTIKSANLKGRNTMKKSGG